MSKLGSKAKTAAVAGAIGVLANCSPGLAALPSSSGTGSEPGGMIWIYVAVFIIGTLGLAFLPSKRREAQ